MTNRYRRQERVFNPETMSAPIYGVGCGSLGSYTHHCLAKLGLTQFHLFDADVVEPHNTPNQLFNIPDEGLSKVDALANKLRLTNNNVNINLTHRHWTPEDTIGHSNVIISAADSMKVRKDVYTKAPSTSFIIDLRSGTEKGDVFFVDKSDEKNCTFYENFLFNDEEASEESCTLQSVGYSSMLLAGLAVDGFLRFMNDDRVPYAIVCDFKHFDFMPMWPDVVK